MKNAPLTLLAIALAEAPSSLIKTDLHIGNLFAPPKHHEVNRRNGLDKDGMPRRKKKGQTWR